ncbi:hypothetical protein B0T25DRAFT_550908 [Lasiosphaeria hispida]|uniref:Uncharacterized protein n=1 Tax=Lasiosphaeria hispida TaxID=260671 RepID=A0AAJ0HAI5_9PEZI|nr:hypothetical protein B0T25DRAFT_550908 [Lasiosphaeria hispida]
MALRQTLSKPFTVEPTADHTHTVVFLHRFPEATSDADLPDKVLSSKHTKNHKTLREQFPRIRWVFPFAKTGGHPYGNLTAKDKAAVGLSAAQARSPYITQILLQEAERAGGLDRVILGGQGETAVAAHEAMASFPEISASMRRSEQLPHGDGVANFLRDTFHAPGWTDAAAHPRLAGFVGMHADSREVTRDIARYGVASKAPNDAPWVNTSIVVNTPHCFIHGGYKVQTTTWDGRRIDDFARFLAEELGIYREVDPQETHPGGKETLTPKDRSQQKEPVEKKGELNDAQKHALAMAKDKKANEALTEKIRRRIEADKVERKFRQDRERQARLAREAREVREGEAQAQVQGSSSTKGQSSSQSQSWNPAFGPIDDEDDEDHFDRSEYRVHRRDDDDGDQAGYQLQYHPKKKPKKQPPGRRAAGESEWETPTGVRGEMSEAQMRAFGLVSEEDKAVVKNEGLEDGMAVVKTDNE